MHKYADDPFIVFVQFEHYSKCTLTALSVQHDVLIMGDHEQICDCLMSYLTHSNCALAVNSEKIGYAAFVWQFSLNRNYMHSLQFQI